MRGTNSSQKTVASALEELGKELRLYGALEPWFDKTWRPGEITLVP